MIKPRIYVVHGWADSPDGSWFPWLKNELRRRGLETHVLEMPKPEWPQIDTWVKTLAAAVGTPDQQTFFVGHSIGCQTILRYLETIPDAVKVGGAVFVAGWVSLKPAAVEDESDKAIADPWLNRPIHWTKIRSHLPALVAIASDNDAFVDLDELRIFRQHLGAKEIILRGHGHIGGEDGVTMLPEALKALENLIGT